MNNAVTGIRGADAEEIYRKYGPMIIRRCRMLLGDADAAADAAQEVFVKLIENRDKLKIEYPSSFLWTMATNLCMNRLRDRKRHGECEDCDTLLKKIAYCEDMEARHVARGVLRKLFSRTPASSRTIAVLHLVDGMTLQETAREVNMSVSGVRKRLRALREILVELEEVEL